MYTACRPRLINRLSFVKVFKYLLRKMHEICSPNLRKYRFVNCSSVLGFPVFDLQPSVSFLKLLFCCLFLSQTKISGVGFVKIHAPWNILCREAEFMKLKMPTKRVRLTVSFCSLSCQI